MSVSVWVCLCSYCVSVIQSCPVYCPPITSWHLEHTILPTTTTTTTTKTTTTTITFSWLFRDYWVLLSHHIMARLFVFVFISCLLSTIWFLLLSDVRWAQRGHQTWNQRLTSGLCHSTVDMSYNMGSVSSSASLSWESCLYVGYTDINCQLYWYQLSVMMISTVGYTDINCQFILLSTVGYNDINCRL